MNRIVLLSWVLASSAFAAGPELGKRFEWLTGDWVVDAKPGEPTGGFSLKADLDGKVLVRKNEANDPATKDKPASSHHDLMIISLAGEVIRANYWDNEGHAIAYTVTAEAEKLVFVSDPAPGPRFRLTYSKRPDGKVGVLFEIAPPNAPDAFKKYLDGVVKRP